MLIKRWKILNQNVTKEASKASKTFMVFKNGIALPVFDAQNTPYRLGWKICQTTKVNWLLKK